MSNIKTLSILIASVLIIVSAIIYMFTAFTASGSVIVGNEYNYNYVTSTDANSTTSLKSLPGSIGSIVVSEDGTTGAISFYATTSAATSSADLVFSFDGAALEGTYQYDISVPGGILMDVSGWNGQAVVTYR